MSKEDEATPPGKRWWHDGTRDENGLATDSGWYLGDEIRPAMGIAILMNDDGAGWVDIVSPRGWGQSATSDGKGFAKRYDSLGRPVFGNRSEFDEAIKKANDHGEKVAAVRARDYDVMTGLN